MVRAIESKLFQVDPHGFEGYLKMEVELSRSDEVFKVKEFQENATLKLQSTNQKGHVPIQEVDKCLWESEDRCNMVPWFLENTQEMQGLIRL
ncbi:hypothetical protein Tco_0362736 [Tanacetum coccineum]